MEVSTTDLDVALTEAVQAGTPQLLWVPVAAGMHAAQRLERSRGPLPMALHSATSLPDKHARALWVRQLRDGVGWEANASDPWEDILEGLPTDAPAVLAFDNVSALLDAYRRWGIAMGAFWNRVRAAGSPVVMVLMDGDAGLLGRLRKPGSPFRHPSEALRPDLAGPPGRWIPLVPSDFGALARRCPEWTGDEVLQAYAMLGGSDEALKSLDPSVRAATNVRRLLLSPDGALFDQPLRRLRITFQSPARYGAVLRALALGGREWGDFVEELAGEVAANALAPYVARLRDLNRVSPLRSLDAAPRSRRSRYRLVDPIDGFWWRFVGPQRAELLSGRVDADAVWAGIREHLGPHLAREAERVLEQAIRLYGDALLGAPARETGALWGEGYDLPLAATLRGGAVCYGQVDWTEEGNPAGALAGITESLRHTRYGYGREARFRLVLSRRGGDSVARATIRRDPMLRIVSPDELVALARR